MHVSFALFADAANLSQEGKLNILGVFDAVQVGQLPAIHPRAHLELRARGRAHDAGRTNVNMRWVTRGGAESCSAEGELDVEGVQPLAVEMDLPLIAAIDLPLDESGAYTMRIALDETPRAEVGLMVRAAPPQFVAPTPAGAMVS